MRLLIISDRSPSQDKSNFLVKEMLKTSGVDIINTKYDDESFGLLDRILHKFCIERDKSNLNSRLLSLLHENHYDAVMIMRGNRLKQKTLKEIRDKALLIGYSGDNMNKWYNRTNEYIAGLKHYHYLFVTNIPSYREIEKYVTGEVIYFDKRADKFLHTPSHDQNKKKLYDVSFIGSYERERACVIYEIVKSGVVVNVWGNRWEKCKYKHPNLKIKFQDANGEKYVEIIRESKIVLGFLRQSNEDTQTSRTFEIPAIGSFALMERTSDHQRLFEEGLEMEFFSSAFEAVEKIKKYLKEEVLREQIALEGRKRVINSGYFFSDLADLIYEYINKKIKIN